MTGTMYTIYTSMRALKKAVSKSQLQDLTAVPTEDFDKAWKAMRKKSYILKTRSKTFALNGTTLAAELALSDRLAS